MATRMAKIARIVTPLRLESFCIDVSHHTRTARRASRCSCCNARAAVLAGHAHLTTCCACSHTTHAAHATHPHRTHGLACHHRRSHLRLVDKRQYCSYEG